MHIRQFMNPSCSLILIISWLAACSATPTRVSPTTALTSALTPIPTLSLTDTAASVKEFVMSDFDAVHSQIAGDPNQYLIFGNVPISKPAADLPPDLAAYLGRWEGYSYLPPVKKDQKFVFVIPEISQQSGKLIGWTGTNLQFPNVVGELRFRVTDGAKPALEWQIVWPIKSVEIDLHL